QNYGECYQRNRDVVKERNRQAGCTCKFLIECDVQDFLKIKREEKNNHHVKNKHPCKFCNGNCQDVSEQVTHQVGGVARCHKNENNSKCHTKRPENGNGGVFAHFGHFGKKLNAQSGANGKNYRSQQWIKSQQKGQANSAKRCVGNAAADKNNSP